jgi:hypothetical protein
MSKSRELVVVRTAAGKPQRRAANRHDWTQAKEAKFLAVLASSCNVTLAAKRAGVANSTVYTQRAKDAAFRDGWARAIAQGYRWASCRVGCRSAIMTRRAITRRGWPGRARRAAGLIGRSILPRL